MKKLCKCVKRNDQLSVLEYDTFCFDCEGGTVGLDGRDFGFYEMQTLLSEWLTMYPKEVFVGLPGCDPGTKFVSSIRMALDEFEERENV